MLFLFFLCFFSVPSYLGCIFKIFVDVSLNILGLMQKIFLLILSSRFLLLI